ncbi:MAG: hypothetical protein IKY89_05495 [Alistipes sp.]|nr:hypothetical protein [Alistipes sp.]
MRNWRTKIIKALGGYTKDEIKYEENKCNTYRGLYETTLCRMRNMDAVRKLSAQYVVGPYDILDDKYEKSIKDMLQRKLMDEMAPFVRIRTEGHRGVIRYTAELDVLDMK